MKEFKYEVLAFRQQADAPIQVAFVAPAGDVLAWSGVPRKSDELLTGYQRFRDLARVDQEIVPFFQDSSNCSPTALIVALRGNSGMGTCSLGISDIEAGQVVPTTLTIKLNDSALETEEVFSAALRYVDTRLSSATNGTSSVTSTEAEVDEESEDDEIEAADEEPTDSGDEGDSAEHIMHLGSVTLGKMKELLSDKTNWKSAGFREAIADYVKPAFLIDGQHRATAAARFGKSGLPFMVCGLYDAPWEEQVFQFTVVNLKPKRIPPSLITSIAGLSLTRSEHDRVQQRLQAAGVPIAEVEIMSLVAYDEKSPFYDLIDMSVKGPAAKGDLLGYGGMKRIAKVWYAGRRPSLTLIAQGIAGTRSAAKARAHWQDQRVWYDFFVAFWSAVKERYTSLWAKGDTNRFFVAAHLWALQEALLGAADAQVASHWAVDAGLDEDERAVVLRSKLLEVIRPTIDYFPDELWKAQWKSGLDTSAGREELSKAFETLVSEGKKKGSAWKGWRRLPVFADE